MATCQRVFYEAMDKVAERTNDDPLKIFKKAVESAKPAVEVKSRRVGGANYQVPREVRRNRQQSLAIRMANKRKQAVPSGLFRPEIARRAVGCAMVDCRQDSFSWSHHRVASMSVATTSTR